MDAPTPRTPPLLLGALVAAIAGLAVAGIGAWRHEAAMRELIAENDKNTALLHDLLGEVTRFRIEQSTGAKGPQALLERLRTYAAAAADTRTAEPDFKNARKEIDATLRAFASLGRDALPPIEARLAEVRPEKDYDEIVQLLRAAHRVDPKTGIELYRQVLLGLKLPFPRLRWFAARELIEHDRPLAQIVLRQILSTESWAGVNPDRAAAFDAAMPDRAAATGSNGFFNFVKYYAESGDAKLGDTLLMVIGRSEHDKMTIQESIKVLGEHRYERAVEAIQNAYRKPPQGFADPIFLDVCATALVDIQHAGAKPFLEQALTAANTDKEAKDLKEQLARIAQGDFAAKPR